MMYPVEFVDSQSPVLLRVLLEEHVGIVLMLYVTASALNLGIPRMPSGRQPLPSEQMSTLQVIRGAADKATGICPPAELDIFPVGDVRRLPDGLSSRLACLFTFRCHKVALRAFLGNGRYAGWYYIYDGITTHLDM